jgi:hypothetical protein
MLIRFPGGDGSLTGLASLDSGRNSFLDINMDVK